MNAFTCELLKWLNVLLSYVITQSLGHASKPFQENNWKQNSWIEVNFPLKMLASDKLLHIRRLSKESADTMAPPCKAFFQEIEILAEDEAALIQISKLLGSRGFGSVYEGKYRGRTVAVKKMKTNSKILRAVLQSFPAETSIASFCHPHIVRTIAVSSLDHSLSERMIIMEFAGSRTLRHILDKEQEVIDEERRMKFASHVTMALKLIHGKDIAHLDVKPANILVDSKDVC